MHGRLHRRPKYPKKPPPKHSSFLQEISKTIGDIYLLGGTVLEEDNGKYYNTSTLWRNGKLLAKYKKISPIKAELEAGVAKGSTPIVLDTDLGKLGMIVCADSFDPSLVKMLQLWEQKLSRYPWLPWEPTNSCQRSPLNSGNCTDYGLFILKVGNVCSNMRGGRSAIIAPWGILGEVTDAPEDSILTADLDMKMLEDYREKLSKS